ncbi:MAG: hypothetical protein ACE365_07770, partial [Gammaproteobacteria bacterium]
IYAVLSVENTDGLSADNSGSPFEISVDAATQAPVVTGGSLDGATFDVSYNSGELVGSHVTINADSINTAGTSAKFYKDAACTQEITDSGLSLAASSSSLEISGTVSNSAYAGTTIYAILTVENSDGEMADNSGDPLSIAVSSTEATATLLCPSSPQDFDDTTRPTSVTVYDSEGTAHTYSGAGTSYEGKEAYLNRAELTDNGGGSYTLKCEYSTGTHAGQMDWVATTTISADNVVSSGSDWSSSTVCYVNLNERQSDSCQVTITKSS